MNQGTFLHELNSSFIDVVVICILDFATEHLLVKSNEKNHAEKGLEREQTRGLRLNEVLTHRVRKRVQSRKILGQRLRWILIPLDEGLQRVLFGATRISDVRIMN